MPSCPFAHPDLSDRTCKREQCGVYNPIIKGCGLMCSAMPMGEELASCRKELARISDNLETLTKALVLGIGHNTEALESIAVFLENLERDPLISGSCIEGRSPEEALQEVQA